MQNILVRALALIECELDIVKMELEHPERFVTADNHPVSNVLWNAKGAKARILELAGDLLHLRELTTLDGTELTFADIVRVFEAAFNTNLKSLYIQRNQCRSRRKSAAPFLKQLVSLVEQDADSIL